ncbi:MAG: bifunctional YncE family protein/alkaline phosphatase family protein [Bacteroidales bacterium]|nr:bifunctional YncE family protein/alkaline phosphatase family protein [Bacteroidales bacterium]
MTKRIFLLLQALAFLSWSYGQSSLEEWSYGRMLSPAGEIISFGDSTLENHALDCALSPDEKWLAVEERYSIVFINTRNNEVSYTLPFRKTKGLKTFMSTYSGITWYRSGEENYVLWSCANKTGGSLVVKAHWNGLEAQITQTFFFPAVEPASVALPNELLIRQESGRDYLYVVLNGNNQLVKLDLEAGKRIWTRDTGVAPYGITYANDKIYVTNWGGRTPLESDKDVAGVPWGLMRIDPSNAASREGSVTVFDPKDGEVIKEIIVGLHPNEIISSPDGTYVYITNSNSDNVSVIQTATDEVSESISLRINEVYNSYFGDSPNGIGLSDNGSTLFVANGMDNAVAMIHLGRNASGFGIKKKSYIQGFIPTGAYPSSVVISGKGRLYITNLEASGATLPIIKKGKKVPIYNSHVKLASISVVKIPGKKKLKSYTNSVYALNQLSRLQAVELPPRKDVLAKPVPDRIGEPSIFKHVIYIIRENRTYDQILGDMQEGDGDSSLCVYGRQVTPNAHKLASEFQLMDNFMVSGKCSAEGHQWTDASIVTDYIEKNMRAWFRSYPHVQTDALVYAPSGFLWDNALRNSKNVMIYGEAAIPVMDDKSLTWTDIYSGFLKGEQLQFTNVTTLNTVKDILSPTFPAYGHGHRIPDVLRAQSFIKDLNNYETMEGDSLPELIIMALPNDHTGGTRPGLPTPRAMIADNDLALGRIVEAVSKSRFWKNTVIFVVEDDSQNGWDHVSAYRTVGFVISPYSRLNTTVHTPYNQPCMVRTIEQILGLQPMNIQDAIAEPMIDCFTETPDFTPYQAVPNQIPLDEINPRLSALEGKALYYAKKSLEPQFEGIDTGDDDLFNRILWHAAMGNKPYPLKNFGVDDN